CRTRRSFSSSSTIRTEKGADSAPFAALIWIDPRVVTSWSPSNRGLKSVYRNGAPKRNEIASLVSEWNERGPYPFRKLLIFLHIPFGLRHAFLWACSRKQRPRP